MASTWQYGFAAGIIFFRNGSLRCALLARARFAALYFRKKRSRPLPLPIFTGASLAFYDARRVPISGPPPQATKGRGIGCAHERRVERSDAGRQSKRNPMRASQGWRARFSEGAHPGPCPCEESPSDQRNIARRGGFR